MAEHTKQPEVLQELFEALGNDPVVIAECLARPALAQRLLTTSYAYDERFHGELRQRAEADLRAHHTLRQMKQTSGKYSEIELVRSDSAPDEENRGAETDLKLNSREWQESIEKLAATFNRAITQLRDGRDGPPGRPSLSAIPEVALYQTIPIEKLSALQQDESRYYATAVIRKPTTV